MPLSSKFSDLSHNTLLPVARRYVVALVLMLLGGVYLLGNAVTHDFFAANDSTTHAPKIKLYKTIRFTWMIFREMGLDAVLRSTVAMLAFSPDSRYLAIALNPNANATIIIVWDIENDREVSRTKLLPGFGNAPDVELLLSKEGNLITSGYSGINSPLEFFDPMTGLVAKEMEIIDGIALWSRLNKDNTKLLVKGRLRAYAEENHNSHFYVISMIDFKIINDIEQEYFEATFASWTADDKVVVGGGWPRSSEGVTYEGLTPKAGDTIIRVIDPTGQSKSRSALYHNNCGGEYRCEQSKYVSFYKWFVDFERNNIGLNSGQILNPETLVVSMDVLNYREKNGAVPRNGQAKYSPDGKMIYKVGLDSLSGQKSWVIDAITGKKLAEFPPGSLGFSVSPSGKLFALGEGHRVEIYSVE
jgi:WD40 repeat protein